MGNCCSSGKLPTRAAIASCFGIPCGGCCPKICKLFQCYILCLLPITEEESFTLSAGKNIGDMGLCTRLYRGEAGFLLNLIFFVPVLTVKAVEIFIVPTMGVLVNRFLSFLSGTIWCGCICGDYQYRDSSFFGDSAIGDGDKAAEWFRASMLERDDSSGPPVPKDFTPAYVLGLLAYTASFIVLVSRAGELLDGEYKLSQLFQLYTTWAIVGLIGQVRDRHRTVSSLRRVTLCADTRPALNTDTRPPCWVLTPTLSLTPTPRWSAPSSAGSPSPAAAPTPRRSSSPRCAAILAPPSAWPSASSGTWASARRRA